MPPPTHKLYSLFEKQVSEADGCLDPISVVNPFLCAWPEAVKSAFQDFLNTLHDPPWPATSEILRAEEDNRKLQTGIQLLLVFKSVVVGIAASHADTLDDYAVFRQKKIRVPDQQLSSVYDCHGILISIAEPAPVKKPPYLPFTFAFEAIWGDSPGALVPSPMSPTVLQTL